MGDAAGTGANGANALVTNQYLLILPKPNFDAKKSGTKWHTFLVDDNCNSRYIYVVLLFLSYGKSHIICGLWNASSP